MHNIELHGLMANCPDWWKNFCSEYVTDTRYGIDYLNSHLVRYNGQLVSDEVHGFCIGFQDLEDFLFFKMKYIGK